METVQQIWRQFLQLINTVRADSITAEEINNFETEGKAWLSLFLSIYQTKNVTPYMHLMIAHLPKFLCIHGPISPFTQQGLEKLNDVYTQFYFRGSNHREIEELKQILLRINRVEYLTDSERNVPVCVLYAPNLGITSEHAHSLHPRAVRTKPSNLMYSIENLRY